MKVAAPFDAYPVSAKKHSHEKERIGSRRARATKDVQRQCQEFDKSGAEGSFRRHSWANALLKAPDASPPLAS